MIEVTLSAFPVPENPPKRRERPSGKAMDLITVIYCDQNYVPL